MLNILKEKQTNLKYKPLKINCINKENINKQLKLNKKEYKNIIYYPSSTKE